jgi:hypothetical protein
MRDKVPCRNVSTGYWFILWRAVSCKCCSQLRNVAIATARPVYASVRKQLCDSDGVAQIQHRMTPPGNSQMHHRPANTLVRTWMVRRGYLLKFGCIPGFSHPAKEACRQQTQLTAHALALTCSRSFGTSSAAQASACLLLYLKSPSDTCHDHCCNRSLITATFESVGCQSRTALALD